MIMYADNITESMEKAITETNRRREIQEKYNHEHHITPRGISKEISKGLRAIIPEKEQKNTLDLRKVPEEEYPKLIRQLESEMKLAAANLEFERAASLRDLIDDIKSGKAAKK